MESPGTATISEVANSFRTRALSPVELLEHHVERIERLNPVLNAFLTLTVEQARVEAVAAESRLREGSASELTGVPIGHKDIYLTKGVRTTAGSRALDHHVPEEDAAVVERLAAAGAVSLGKTHCHELACGAMEGYGVTRNPWDVGRAAGGSSSGSAAAVAAGLVLAATASDTGGSVRVPAAFTGTVGFKPTFGRVSRHGIFPISYTLDHPAVLARCVADAELVYRELAFYDAKDRLTSLSDEEAALSEPDRQGFGTVRVGLPHELFASGVMPEVSAALLKAASCLEEQGAVLVPVQVEGFESVAPVHTVVWLAEAASRLRRLLLDQREPVGSVVRKRLLPGLLLSTADYFVAMHERERLRESMERLFHSVDVLLLPAAPFTAHLIDDVTSARSDVSRFNRLANLTGEPAVALPCGFGEAGLPIGMQLMAGRWQESLLLRVARCYEQANGWWRATPKVVANTVGDGREEAYLSQLTSNQAPTSVPVALAGEAGEATIDWVRTRATAAGLDLTEPGLWEMSAQFHRTRVALDAMHARSDAPFSTSAQDFVF
ncbi:MAG: amidase [Trueperaceae bacterium]|nr:amidase [Trueperaceae bacterium]